MSELSVAMSKLPKALTKHICTIREASMDTEHHIPMVDSDFLVVNFDDVKNTYNKKLKSNDALFVDSRHRIFFIEFKNGTIDDIKNIELYERMSRRNSDFVEMLGIDKVEEIEKESRRQLKEEFFKNIKELEKYQEEIKSGSGDMDEFLRIEKAKVELREIYDRCVLIHPLLMPNLIPLEDFDDLDELYKKYCKRK